MTGVPETPLGGIRGMGTVTPGITGELGCVAIPDVSNSCGEIELGRRPLRGKTGSGVSWAVGSGAGRWLGLKKASDGSIAWLSTLEGGRD
jgi:hypothetical protein